MFADVPELYQALVLGILQGLTEFLPISSSGHLVILPTLLQWSPPSLLTAMVVHLGTLLSVVWVFRRNLQGMARDMWRTLAHRRWASYQAREGYFICLAAIPVVAAGYYLQPFLATAMSSPVTAAYGLCITALLLGGSELIAHWRAQYRYMEEMTWLHAVWMGLGQALALVPGISRSGATIAMGHAQSLERPGVARFSFLMGLPIMLGAGLLEFRRVLADPTLGLATLSWPLAVSFLASALTGVLTIRFLMHFVRRHSLMPFAGYCLMLGLGLLSYLRLASFGA